MSDQLALQLEEHISTQCKDVLIHLEANGQIDPLIALNDYGIMRLAARIKDLRNKGFTIHSEMVAFTSRYGRRSAFCRYSI